MNSKERQRGGILQGRYKAPQFEVSYNSLPGKVSMHDDLMQDGLLRKNKGAGSFITIGETPHSDSQRISSYQDQAAKSASALFPNSERNPQKHLPLNN